MKKFDIPKYYRSPVITRLKEIRKKVDRLKKDFSPAHLNFGPVEFLIARHFGFCYGVENAIEIAYRIVEENPHRRIFLLSEMIHNPHVNEDLRKRGIQFIMDNYGNHFIEWDEINSDDIVIIPAFGTTIEIENLLKEKGIDIVSYNTTCPFVEKVWNRAEVLGKQNYTIVIHGKAKHEETRATFSHTIQNSPSVIIRDIEEAKFLSDVILGSIPEQEFYSFFEGKYSANFNVEKDLIRIGVVNQTTMLAGETQAIADLLKATMIKKYGEENIKEHFADTRDTLCYATNDNQTATIALTKEEADFAIVVGGYNSSNTSHLAELLEQKFKTYFISDASKILSHNRIYHYDIHLKKEIVTDNFIPQKEKVKIAITSGASCPDAIVDEVLNKLLSFFEGTESLENVLSTL
ncbi:MAG: 4-hydroxy-3-methylbut-2-enyl diphosphate reductase [Melioribacter sp.]|uniref:4-hydroxy-3-methylbut-2-enyl diphosphate reductase n=1 Tax=Rosettibacter primus TaxID=3111523 RepID=UPI00247BEC8A|nr:4-hydroxy-3-methylbut-2-enyl diphosphate reductase [Melioribacter sp.]